MGSRNRTRRRRRRAHNERTLGTLAALFHVTCDERVPCPSRGHSAPPPPSSLVTLYRDLRASSFHLTFRLLHPLTDNHAPSSGSPLSPAQSSIRPPSRPFPCSPFQNRSPRSLHHPRSVSANMKRCKLLQSGGGAGRNPSPCMFEVCLSRLAVPPFFNAYKNIPNHSVLLHSDVLLLKFHRC